MNTPNDSDVALLPPLAGSPDGWHAEYLKASDRAMQMEIERNDARRDRDEWKASAAQYHQANTWLDAERSKFIAALRAIDPEHPILPENRLHEPRRAYVTLEFGTDGRARRWSPCSG